MGIFDRRSDKETYVFDENEYAYSDKENRKNYLKEEITSKFVQLSKKNTCMKVKRIDDEFVTKYEATFTDRIPMTILIYTNTLDKNNIVVTALNRCIKDKPKFSFINKKKTIAILVGGAIALATPPAVIGIVKTINNSQIESTIENVKNNLSDPNGIENEEQKIENEILLQQEREQEIRNNQIEKEQEVEDESTRIRNLMDQQQEEYEKEQERLLNEAREYDMNQYEENTTEIKAK